MRRSRPFFAPLATAGLLLMAACQAQPPAPSGAASSPEQAEAALLARIRGEIGEARCSTDAQCHTLALGEKACGGPAGYLAWSGTEARGRQLQAWSAELAMMQRKRAASSGMMSNCMFLADPGAVCVQQRCVLGSGAGAAAAR